VAAFLTDLEIGFIAVGRAFRDRRRGCELTSGVGGLEIREPPGLIKSLRSAVLPSAPLCCDPRTPSLGFFG
jgi:hypothetical protein